MPSSSAKPRPVPSSPPRSADHLRLVVPPAAGASAMAKGVAVAAAAAARPKAAAAAARSIGDWAWHGLGLGVATASAGFATYAMIFSTGEVVPSGNFNLFGRYDRPFQAASAQHVRPASNRRSAEAPAAQPAPERTDVASKDPVDFEPTGSLATRPGGPQSQGDAGAASRNRRTPDGPTLPHFTLRDVFDGKALVESRSSLSVVKPGSVLDGAGEVLSIEKRGEHWVVLTSNGVIAGQRR